MDNDIQSRFENDPLLKYREIRMDDIKDISEMIQKAPSRAIRGTINYYPFRFFADGVQAYLYVFDNAVAYYSGMAVEIGLLIKMRDFIKTTIEDRNQRVFIPNFKWLVNHSQSILSIELRNKAHCVRKLRNCYLHYENIAAHTAWMDQVEWPETVNMLRNEFKDDSEILEKIELLANESEEYSRQHGMFTVRFDFLEPNEEMMPFIESRYKEYIEWFPEILRKKKNTLNDVELSSLYGIEAFDALSCLKLSYEVLKELNYF